MPVLVARRAPDHVTCTNLDNGFTFALGPAAARRDDKGLPQRMGVPGGAGARFEGDAGDRDASGFRREVERVDTNGAGKPFLRAFDRWL
ncbi:hypothetical protein D3C80_1116050 [compost metagenome]